jgi:hypothetical protein
VELAAEDRAEPTCAKSRGQGTEVVVQVATALMSGTFGGRPTASARTREFVEVVAENAAIAVA